MKNEPTKSGLKSALDLAMERLAQKEGQLVQLTDEQKKALAEIGQKAKAKLAEVEIMFQQRVDKARAGDPEKVEQEIQKIQSELAIEREHIRSQEEREKERIRKG